MGKKREMFKYAGMEVKVKDGVGCDLGGNDLSGETFIIEDWFCNVVGESWMWAEGNITALIYGARIAHYGKNNGVPIVDDDVLYGKIAGMGYAFNVRELEFPEEFEL